MNDALNNARGWWDVFFGQHEQANIPKPIPQLTLQGWKYIYPNMVSPIPAGGFQAQNIAPVTLPKPAVMRVSQPKPENISWLEQQVLPITRKGNIPDPTAAGQWAIEGRKKDTSMYNLLIGGKPHVYQNTENNVNDYVRTVTNILKKKGYDLNQIKDPEQILNLLQEGNYRFEGHSSDPLDYIKIIKQTPEYQYYLNR